MSIWSRWKTILMCTGLNFLFEYAVRGISNFFAVPWLNIGIIGTYFAYFTILEELIVRYKLKDYQLLLWGFFLGIFAMAFTGGQMFNIRPGFEVFYVFGINYLDFIFVNFIWWSLFQTVITFYFAYRVSVRDWEKPKLGKLGWALAILLYTLMLFFFQLGRYGIYRNFGFILDFFQVTNYIVFGTLEGYISMLIFVIIFGFLSFRELKKNEENEVSVAEFEPSKFIDVILIITIAVSIICAFFIGSVSSWSGASLINRVGSAIIVIWAIIFGIIIVIYRFITKKPISV